jgi:capsular polysaccharide export protein
MMRAIVDNDLSKYNQAPPFVAPDAMRCCSRLTFGDMSVAKGNAGRKLPVDAGDGKQENPNAEIG